MSKSQITINGKTYQGSNITIVDNRIKVDGVDYTPEEKIITLQVDGNIDYIAVDACHVVTVNGNVTGKGGVKTMSGDVKIIGDILQGNVSTMSGDVECGSIGGSVKTMSGDVTKL